MIDRDLAYWYLYWLAALGALACVAQGLVNLLRHQGPLPMFALGLMWSAAWLSMERPHHGR